MHRQPFSVSGQDAHTLVSAGDATAESPTNAPSISATVDAAFNLVAERNLSGLRSGYASGVDSTTLNRLRSILGQTNVVRIKLPSYPNHAMFTILFVEAAAALDDLTRFGGAKFLVTDSSSIMLHAHTVPAVEYLQANRLREKFIRDMAIVLENVDVYVDDVAADFEAVGANLCGLPCFVIPNGGEKSLVIVGQLYEEGTLLELASAYQETTPFHTQYPPAFRR